MVMEALEAEELSTVSVGGNNGMKCLFSLPAPPDYTHSPEHQSQESPRGEGHPAR